MIETKERIFFQWMNIIEDGLQEGRDLMRQFSESSCSSNRYDLMYGLYAYDQRKEK